MAIHIVLYQPLIPANTGNIARSCAGTGVKLHLIRPLGFSTDDKMLKRAGLDYWEHVDIHYYDGLQELFDRYQDGEFYYITKFGAKPHTSFDFSEREKDHFFIFGQETKGLPQELLEQNPDHCLRIPMNDNIRSLNLSNTAAILMYEALRQQDYPGLE
ncbi:tRNA (uridine(34)/cytosine(34)/5-carboxymethylaminomethyluridine(34)-2'-O)-methyltransferase TrmL [Planococcus sp. ISL-110]|uniref:tRNA (uridine(34)/cytosine(34)/5- carboxymethylaminomethyluridine(34)-2'-O)- methyltransferase TrmL n=1 Tax=Planococcus sp. ISL-110 TaxID=2819167 RepID=UPI001BE6C5D3|nr:tRNA (uridine(34)/cytosine(34)/5-carboxymethylaminomethyluridine(34)-2'-O)-methyltransferase TrmL [Planococcus sp. ISL-110]MBT2571818.1 tRNA (uridine(34)/cytosine(34)/5-carboxymethylaminomethyluridine(34)-2'-O)-methyltransferase TrmL [Planococcus sp. ISL-110]